MPDWIHNTLKIIGDDADVQAFLGPDLDLDDLPEYDEDDLFSFQTQMPVEDQSEPYWESKNYGTTMPVYTRFLRNSDGVTITFDSAWRPPHKWFRHVVAKFPQLEFDLFWVLIDEVRGFYIGNEGVVKSFISQEGDMWSK